LVEAKFQKEYGSAMKTGRLGPERSGAKSANGGGGNKEVELKKQKMFRGTEGCLGLKQTSDERKGNVWGET